MWSGSKLNSTLAVFLSALFFIAPNSVLAQQVGAPSSSILTISSDRLFVDSAFGRRVAGELEARSAVLSAENRRIEAELEAEEQDLTERRSEMEAEAFRVLADAFDQKVQQIRSEQEAKNRELSVFREGARIEFLNAAAPILETVMRESGAAIILERSSVFLSANATDITDLAIERIDLILGDGAQSAADPTED